MNPEEELLAALVAYRSAVAAARLDAEAARARLAAEPLANTLKAFSALEQAAYSPPQGSPGVSLESTVAEAISQLQARAGTA
ncbi:hypothetical protein DMC25_27090 [Caulobacter sp. D4A]|uniref:hypothetical protein n=1 Tax=unclassified Caulobacter TaxID=2648921 RepID=UPI000D733040|nr:MULTISPECIES: hypothetical protein [unclassified Caulobacter]PXA70417.1 hypothetical protein DMC25_27090 [Caulobacter sp. D4A]PXA96810.1 hypothetical protein DMC18_00675 [Caulobacter sp. D5]